MDKQRIAHVEPYEQGYEKAVQKAVFSQPFYHRHSRNARIYEKISARSTAPARKLQICRKPAESIKKIEIQLISDRFFRLLAVLGHLGGEGGYVLNRQPLSDELNDGTGSDGRLKSIVHFCLKHQEFIDIFPVRSDIVENYPVTSVRDLHQLPILILFTVNNPTSLWSMHPSVHLSA